MAGRWILTLMIVFSLGMAGLFYWALTKAPEYKELVVSQMKTEFQDYCRTILKIENLKVAEMGDSSYFVNTQADWKFDLHDKTLVVTSPTPAADSGSQPLPAEQLESARKSVETTVWTWLDDKFKSRKDLKLEVRFANEPAAK